MKDQQQAYDLLSKLRQHKADFGDVEAEAVTALLDNLADRTNRIEVNQAQVDYTAQARAQREEAEAKRDLALLLFGAAQSVAGSVQRAAELARIVNLTVSANAMALLRRVLP